MLLFKMRCLRCYTIFIFLFISKFSLGQDTISGVVTDLDYHPIVGANVFVVGTYDGGITDTTGAFKFVFVKEENQILQVSYLGYLTKFISLKKINLSTIHITLKKSMHSLETVVVTSSNFNAGDASSQSVLSSLDVVTTAGANGDVIGALQTLPGTQKNSTNGRLFVRGGDARETQIYIDGLKVFSPYTRTFSGTPVRGRFSPFLFEGINFSTGAYDASYGQALSGVLDMKTKKEVYNTHTDISLLTVAVAVGHTQKWDKQSLSFNAVYTDLGLYHAIVPNRINWEKNYRGFSGEMIYRTKWKNGRFKSYFAGNKGGFQLIDDKIIYSQPISIAVNNGNYYTNNTLNVHIKDKHELSFGISAGINNDLNVVKDSISEQTTQKGLHVHTSLKSYLHEKFMIDYGIETFLENIEYNLLTTEENKVFQGVLDDKTFAFYTNGKFYFSKKSGLVVGLRLEKSKGNDKLSIMPRVTFSQKLADKGQINVAYGIYSQNAEWNLRLYDKNLLNEYAEHYVLSYQYKYKKNIFRLEGYYKNYSQLPRFSRSQDYIFNISQDGLGYAYGVDVFWKATNLVKNVDFWLSYSWIKHRRKYRDFPTWATPNFSPEHNLSIVTKTWISTLQSQLGISYSFASGRPYENPNTSGFLNERSKPYHDVSISWSYLIDKQKILFLSISNVANIKNEYGYQYALKPDPSGIYPSEVIRSNADQFFLIGFFMTISKNKELNQINKL